MKYLSESNDTISFNCLQPVFYLNAYHYFALDDSNMTNSIKLWAFDPLLLTCLLPKNYFFLLTIFCLPPFNCAYKFV